MLTQTKVYLYNGEGELAETALYNGEVSAANEQQRYRYEYDSLGRVICSQEITNGALHQGTIKLLLQQAQNIRALLHMRKTIFLAIIWGDCDGENVQNNYDPPVAFNASRFLLAVVSG